MANLKLLLVLSIVAVIKSDDKFPIEPTHEKHSSSTGTSSHQPNITTTTLHPKTTTFVPPTINPTTSPNTTVSPNITTTTTTTAKPSTTTTSTTITPPTTLKPNTTTTSTTTVTPTTPKPTTTVPPTTPKPTTIAPPTPTPSPAPIPDPQTGNWSVNIKDSNYSCMVLDAAIQIEFLLGNTTKKVNLPVNAISEGNCQNDSDVINLKWDKNSLTLDFNQTVKDSKFELKSIKAVFVNLSLPVDTKNYTLVHNTPEFQTPLGNSYKCMKVQTLNLTEENGNKTIAYLHISNVQLQAFGNTTGHKFNAAIDCEASPITSDVVPIVVGCVLAALVIMIVVAYLIARRRCQARGYLSIDAQADD